MIGFLIAVVCVVVFLVIVKTILDWMEADPPLRKIALLIAGLIALVWLLTHAGVMGPAYRVW